MIICYPALLLKGTVHPPQNNHIFPVVCSVIYSSRLFWCKLVSFGDFIVMCVSIYSLCICVCVCVCCFLTQDRKGNPKQEHGHPSQHWYEEVTGQKNGQHGDWWVVSTETANGSLVLGSPNKAQEQQGEHCCADEQLEGLEISERKETVADRKCWKYVVTEWGNRSHWYFLFFLQSVNATCKAKVRNASNKK